MAFIRPSLPQLFWVFADNYQNFSFQNSSDNFYGKYSVSPANHAAYLQHYLWLSLWHKLLDLHICREAPNACKLRYIT